MGVRVLIIEQADTARDAYVAALRDAGMDAYAAKSITEAAELLAKRGAHVVVLDLLIVPENAIWFIAGVLGAMPQTRIIATMARSAMRQASQAVHEGAFDYLVKPIDTKRLAQTVLNAVDGKFTHDTATDPYCKAFVDATGSQNPVSKSAYNDNANSSLADLVNAEWTLTDLERLVIELAISQDNGLAPKVAKQLNVSPSTLYRKREVWLAKEP